MSNLNTSNFTGAENRRPALETVNAQTDHFPAFLGAVIDNSVEEVSDLKQKLFIKKEPSRVVNKISLNKQ